MNEIRIKSKCERKKKGLLRKEGTNKTKGEGQTVHYIYIYIYWHFSKAMFLR
jgi:hypothetical protein